MINFRIMIQNTAFPQRSRQNCCFICVFAVLVNKVSLQVTVEGVIGGSVVLSCSSAQHDHELQDIDVYWVYSGNTNVFDIIKGKDSVEGQDPRYKNRAETFRDEYLRANFSLKLINLQHTDAGKYTCLISHSSEHKTVELIIKDSPTKKGNETIDQEIPNQAETVPNVVTSLLVIIVVTVLVLVLLIVIIVCFIIFYLRKKRTQAPLFSSDMIEEQTTVT